jgi:hypothetical protein
VKGSPITPIADLNDAEFNVVRSDRASDNPWVSDVPEEKTEGYQCTQRGGRKEVPNPRDFDPPDRKQNSYGQNNRPQR